MGLHKEFERQGNWLFRNRSWLPLVALAPTVAFIWQQHLEMAHFPGGLSGYMRYETACLVVGLAGLAVRIYAVGHSRAGTSGRNTGAGQIAGSLNTSGVYSVVRHPLYLGNFLMWLGTAMLTGNVWFVIVFTLVFWLYYERIMYAEEQFLERKFGEQFTGWAKHTPTFVPRPGRFVKPDCPFCWKKILRAEKNGLFGLFLVFFTFDFAGAIIRGDSRYNYILMSGCIVSGILYATLKYLKYRTGILNV